MIVWIVVANGEVDQVFDNFMNAEHHRLQLQKKWNFTKIVRKEIQSL